MKKRGDVLALINKRLTEMQNRLEMVFNAVCTVNNSYQELHNLEDIELLRKELAKARSRERVRRFRKKEEARHR